MIKRGVRVLRTRISQSNKLLSFLFLFIIGMMLMFSVGIMILEVVK
ncbi:MAG: hypothetical protein Q8O03_01815 [Nanoarchaeota archaeon]|nr:hypothetical protein [Nanoarchaeota archaeon]